MEHSKDQLSESAKSEQIGRELDLRPLGSTQEMIEFRPRRDIRQLGRLAIVAEYTAFEITAEAARGHQVGDSTLKLKRVATFESMLPKSRRDKRERKKKIEAVLERRRSLAAKPEPVTGQMSAPRKMTKSQEQLLKKFVMRGPSAFALIPSGEARPIQLGGVTPAAKVRSDRK